MRVLVTRPAAQADAWVLQLRERGFDAVGLPLIAIEAGAFAAQVGDAWRNLAGARAAMFVSANAVRGFFDGRPADGARRAWPAGTRAWATGPGTRQALIDHGLAAAQIDAPSGDAAQFDSEALWDAAGWQVKPGDAVLIVRGADAEGEAVGRGWLADRLQAAGASVHVVASYARALPCWSTDEFALARDGAVGGAWLFSSSQAIVHLGQLLPEVHWGKARAVVTHPRIAQAAQAAGFGVVCVSRPEVDDVARALESFR